MRNITIKTLFSRKNRIKKITVNMQLFLFLIFLSVSAWIISYSLGLTVIYNDAMSHLNLSRLVIDNIKPGLPQMGSVWLPLSHILTLAFIWNNWAWHSGFAGSIYSMVSYIVSAWAIYKTIMLITKNQLAAIIGMLAFALNLNMLYLQTTPLTEPLYVVFFTVSILMFTRWLFTQNMKYLLLLGLLGFMQVLSRYDGWFVVMFEGLLVLSYLLFIMKDKFSDVVGKLFVFAFPVLFGISIWILWNALIFHDPLYFALGPYSAHAQQAHISTITSLITKGNLWQSIRAYTLTVIANVGMLVFLLSTFGLVIFSTVVKSVRGNAKLFFLLFLLAPVIFNILALFFGFSILNVPAMHWNPSHEYGAQWFNVRYGILALPAVAILVGIGVVWKKWVLPVALAIILLQFVLMFPNDIITISDGLYGSSSFYNQDLATAITKYVKPTERVLLSTSYFNPVAFRSNINLSQIIHEGVGNLWTDSLASPEKHAEWIVMANGDVGDPVYTSLVKKQKDRFLATYIMVYKGTHGDLYRRKNTDELFVTRKSSKLMVGTKQYVIKGVNEYDLAYKTPDQITATFSELQKSGINTVRFWAFGEGTPDGFQPTVGELNQSRISRMDFIIQEAKKRHIRLIPVLGDNGTDFGGKAQYLTWLGKNPLTDGDEFFTNPDAKNLYSNYMNKIITHINSLSNVSYANDPTILAWDLMNGPEDDSGDTTIISSWVKDMATQVKKSDSNHLLTVGSDTNFVYSIDGDIKE